MAAKKKAAKKTAPKAPKAAKAGNDNASTKGVWPLGGAPAQGAAAKPPQGATVPATAAPAGMQLTADQVVMGLANAIAGIVSGQNAQLALNGLAAATARVCLRTRITTVDFQKLVTTQVEVQAGLMLAEAQAQMAAPKPAPKTPPASKGGKSGSGAKRGAKRGGKAKK